MLVLAMEFSRGAQRAFGPPTSKNRPTTGRDAHGRAAGTRSRAEPASRRRDGIASGCPNEQEPRVTPSKRNSDARCHPQSPQA